MPNDATYGQLLGDGKAFLDFVCAFLWSVGVQLTQQATGHGSGGLTRYSPDVRVRLGGVISWRLQCTTGNAVFTVLPHVVVRDRQMQPAVARDALLATQGGRSVAWCAAIGHVFPLAVYRWVCALGQPRVMTVLTRCGLPLPAYCLADETHRPGLTDHVDLPTLVKGRLLGPLGATANARAAAFIQAYGAFQRAASQPEPASRGRGILTDGFDSTTKRLRTLLPGARLGNCPRHALMKLPKQLAAIASPVRRAVRSPFHTLVYWARQRQGWRVLALGQRWRHVADHVTNTAGAANGACVRPWFHDKKAGWYAVREDPQRPVTSTRLDQAHHAMDRQLLMMKGCHHPQGT